MDDLRNALNDLSFTPGRKHVAPLLELLVVDEDERLHRAIERTLLRVAEAAEAALVARLAQARPDDARVRPRLAHALARLLSERGDVAALARLATDDPDPKARRLAIVALGKVPGPEAETALLALWRQAATLRPEHRRALVTALGTAGGAAALEALGELDPGADAELARLLERARLMLARTATRGQRATTATPATAAPAASELDPTTLTSQVWPVVARCRAGLEELLADELASWRPRVVEPGVVRIDFQGRLHSLYRARLLLDFAFVLPDEQGADPVAAAVKALTSDAALAVFRTFTQTPTIRYRLAWADAGHRRGDTWKVATAVAAQRPELVNDPTKSPWQVTVYPKGGRRFTVELTPRGLADPRFAYRLGDVPASSHPTIAAALARVAGVRPDDVVWDPFVGSGTELAERAVAGAYRSLTGTDLDPKALAIAQANLAAAKTHDTTLTVADATTHVVPGVTLILSNPPLGRRLRGDVGPLFDAFIANAARQLAPGGRLVYISPLPERTRAAAARAGLTPTTRLTLDLGGFTADLEAYEKGTGKGKGTTSKATISKAAPRGPSPSRSASSGTPAASGSDRRPPGSRRSR